MNASRRSSRSSHILDAVDFESFPGPACSNSDSTSRIDRPRTNAPITSPSTARSLTASACGGTAWTRTAPPLGGPTGSRAGQAPVALDIRQTHDREASLGVATSSAQRDRDARARHPSAEPPGRPTHSSAQVALSRARMTRLREDTQPPPAPSKPEPSAPCLPLQTPTVPRTAATRRLHSRFLGLGQEARFVPQRLHTGAAKRAMSNWMPSRRIPGGWELNDVDWGIADGLEDCPSYPSRAPRPPVARRLRLSQGS